MVLAAATESLFPLLCPSRVKLYHPVVSVAETWRGPVSIRRGIGITRNKVASIRCVYGVSHLILLRSAESFLPLPVPARICFYNPVVRVTKAGRLFVS